MRDLGLASEAAIWVGVELATEEFISHLIFLVELEMRSPENEDRQASEHFFGFALFGIS